MHRRDARTKLRALLHLGDEVGQEHELTIAGPGNQRVLRVAIVGDDEPRVNDMGLPSEAFQVGLPALAVGRVGEHEVELLAGESVVGQGRPLGATHDVVRRLAVALEDEVGLCDGVGLCVDLLPVQVRGDLLAQWLCELLEGFFSDGEHAAGAHRSVVETVRARGNPVGDRLEHEAGHQPHRVAWRPVLARFLVVVLVEAAHQLFEHGAHAVVVQARRGEVEVGRAELLDVRS